MTRQLSVLVAIVALCSVLLYAGCNATTEAPTAEPSPTEQANRSSGFGEYGVMHLGLITMEELVLHSAAIARVEFVSAEQGVEAIRITGSDQSTRDYYVGAVVITFNVLEYLKGSGGSQIKAILYDGDNRAWTAAEITAAGEDFLAIRDKRWDDRETVVFLHSGELVPSTLTDSDRYYMGLLRANGELAYTVDSKWAKAWLPAAAPGVGGGARGASSSGDNQRFITNIQDGGSGGGRASGQSSTTESMTLAEIKTFVKRIEDEVAAGDGTAAYRDCVEEKYDWVRLTAKYKDSIIDRGDSWQRQFPKRIASGAAAGTEVYTGGDFLRLTDADKASEPSWSDDAIVKSGQDEDLFAHTWPLIATTARPLPAGTYRFYWAEQDESHALCNAMPEEHRTRDEIVLTVTAPEGTLHEAFFDPVNLTSGVGVDSSNGVLKPASFTVDGSSTSITSLKWDNDSVVLTLSPHSSLSGHKLDFIELDGSVSLALEVSFATEDTTAGTLTWSVPNQPWHDGDTLMLRIAASTTPEPTPVPTAEPTPVPEPTPTPEPTPEASSSVTVTLSPRQGDYLSYTNITIDWTDPNACDSRYLVGVYSGSGGGIIRDMGFHPAPATSTLTSETRWIWGYITNQDWWARVTCAPADGSVWRVVGETRIQTGLPDAP